MKDALDIEADLRTLADSLTAPGAKECVLCYTARQVAEFGCDTTLRWATRWRDLRLPRATGLEKRLGRVGGFCDCEIFLNGWDLRDALCPLDDESEPVGWPDPLPSCALMSVRSSQPCANWRRVVR